MKYANGGTPQIGDRASFSHWNGRHEGTVTKVGRTFIRIDYPSTASWARDGLAYVTVLPFLARLVGPVVKKWDAAGRPDNRFPESLHSGDPVIQEVILNIDGRKEVVMNMGPGVNMVLLSGKVDPDTDFEERVLWLELFPNTRIEVPMGGLSGIDIGDEVMVTGHIEEGIVLGERMPVLVADSVVKLS